MRYDTPKPVNTKPCQHCRRPMVSNGAARYCGQLCKNRAAQLRQQRQDEQNREVHFWLNNFFGV